MRDLSPHSTAREFYTVLLRPSREVLVVHVGVKDNIPGGLFDNMGGHSEI